MCGVKRAVGFVSDTLAQKDDGDWNKPERTIFNEATMLEELTEEDFLSDDVHDVVSQFSVMKFIVQTHNFVDEYGRKLLLSIFTSPAKRRLIEKAKGSISSNSDVESIYGMTTAVSSVLDELESGEGSSTLYGVEAARGDLAAYRIPWGSLTQAQGVRKHLEKLQGLYENFADRHNKLQLERGYGGLPGESQFFSLVRVICPPDSDHTSSQNFLKVTSQVTQMVGDSLQLVLDEHGVNIPDEKRYDSLYQKLCTLDVGAKWTKEPKLPGNSGQQSKQAPRERILQATDKRSGTKDDPLSGLDFNMVCRQFMHTGGCARARNCKYIHLNQAQLEVYPTCNYHGCTLGQSCKFKHSTDTINAAGASSSVDTKSASKKGASLLKKKAGAGKKPPGEQLLLLRTADDLDDIDEESGDDGDE
jgi:hypothetical protein